MRKQWVTALALAGVSGCANVQNIGGVDAVAPVVRPFAASLDAASASQTTAAQTLRADRRRLYVLSLVASGAPLATDQFDDVLCVGYGAVEDMRQRALELQAAQNGLEQLVERSPDTIVGLVGSIQHGSDLPAIQAHPPARHLAADCGADAGAAPHAYPTPNVFRTERFAMELLDAVQLFRSVIRPIVVQGLTRVDRARRLEVLQTWARDNEHGLPALLRLLELAEHEASQNAVVHRRLAAGSAYEAWDALARARQGAALEICPSVEGGLDTLCVGRVEDRISSQLSRFLSAASSYDTTFDLDPSSALHASVRSAHHLSDWLNGDLSEEDASAAQAAAFVAIEQWLEVLAKTEALWEDPATKRRLSEAARELQEALGGDD